jgi:hypothetical protein
MEVVTHFAVWALVTGCILWAVIYATVRGAGDL